MAVTTTSSSTGPWAGEQPAQKDASFFNADPTANSMFATSILKPEAVSTPTADMPASMVRWNEMSDEQKSYLEIFLGRPVLNDDDIAEAECIIFQQRVDNQPAVADNTMPPPAMVPAPPRFPNRAGLGQIQQQIVGNQTDLGCGIFPGCSICAYLNSPLDVNIDLDPNGYLDKAMGMLNDIFNAVSENSLVEMLGKLLQCAAYISQTRVGVLGTMVAMAAKRGKHAVFAVLMNSILPPNMRNFQPNLQILATNMPQSIQTLAALATMLSGYNLNPNFLFSIGVNGITGKHGPHIWAMLEQGQYMPNYFMGYNTCQRIRLCQPRITRYAATPISRRIVVPRPAMIATTAKRVQKSRVVKTH